MIAERHPRVFHAKAIVQTDDTFEVDLILDRTVIRGSRISLYGSIQYDGPARRRRWLDVRSNFIRAGEQQ